MKNETRFKNLYKCLLESDELKMFKGMKGEWEKDKERFIKEQLKLEDLANIIDVDDYE